MVAEVINTQQTNIFLMQKVVSLLTRPFILLMLNVYNLLRSEGLFKPGVDEILTLLRIPN